MRLQHAAADANGPTQFRSCDRAHPRRLRSRRRGQATMPPANDGPRSAAHGRSAASPQGAQPSSRPPDGAFKAQQRNDYKFTLKAASACESRMIKFQESGLWKTFSVVPGLMSLNPSSPIAIYSTVRAVSDLRQYSYSKGIFASF